MSLTRSTLRRIERRTGKLRKTYVGCKVWLQEGSYATWSMSSSGKNTMSTFTGFKYPSNKKAGVVVDITCDPVLRAPHRLKIVMDEYESRSSEEDQDDGCSYVDNKQIAKKQRLTAEELLTHHDERVRKLAI